MQINAEKYISEISEETYVPADNTEQRRKESAGK